MLGYGERGIRRPVRVPRAGEIEAQAAPIIPMPRARDLGYREPPMVPSVGPVPEPSMGRQRGPGVAQSMEYRAGVDDMRPEAMAVPRPDEGIDAGASGLPAESIGRPEAPGTRHGVGGRIKDFLESLLYSGGNPIAAGVAAASPGKLAQWKWNQIEQPRLDREEDRAARLEAQREQARYRGMQGRKYEADVKEDDLTRPYRIRQMQANTTKAEADAEHARRVPATPYHNAQILDADTPDIMQLDPSSGRAVPVMGENGRPVPRYRTPVRSEMTPGEKAAQERADRGEADKLMGEHAELKRKATEAGAEVGAMSKALGGANESGQAYYKGQWITRADLERAEQTRQAVSGEMQNAAARLRATGRVTVSEDGTDVKPVRSPQADGGGRVVTYQGKKYKVAGVLPSGELDLEPVR